MKTLSKHTLMNRTSLLALLSLSLLAGCGSNKEFTYSLEENGCKTGEHHFSSQEELCAGLKNDSLNNNCATSLRSQKFANDSCPGTY